MRASVESVSPTMAMTGAPRERAGGVADDGQHRRAPVLQVRQQLKQLGRLAAVADEEAHVGLRHEPHAAVQGVRGVEEDGRRARARQGGGGLLRDVARLADADGDDLAPAPE